MIYFSKLPSYHISALFPQEHTCQSTKNYALSQYHQLDLVYENTEVRNSQESSQRDKFLEDSCSSQAPALEDKCSYFVCSE